MNMKKENTAGPVFVVGVNGSGTTMLADCLGHHPDLYMFPEETKVLPYFIYKIKSFGNLSELDARKRLAAELGKCWAYRMINKGKPVVLEDKMLSEPGFNGVLNSLYGYFAKKQGKRRWGEKTPMYLQHLEILAKFIPNIKFIHIYRDGRDVARSLNRRFFRDPKRTIYRWKKILKLSRKQADQLGSSKYMEIRYEDLVGNPDFYMREICDFLELNFNSNVLKSSLPYSRDYFVNKKEGTIFDNHDKWKTYFNSKTVLELEKIAGTFLEELGYNTVYSKGDNDLSKSSLLAIKIIERIRQSILFFKTNRKKPVSQFYFRAKEALKQDYTNRF
jgi:hypothetical protein